MSTFSRVVGGHQVSATSSGRPLGVYVTIDGIMALVSLNAAGDALVTSTWPFEGFPTRGEAEAAYREAVG